PFRVPAAVIVCPLGVAACLFLFWQPFREHWELFVSWTALGMLVYFGYGYWHSRLRICL
ncbi:MAG: amino acid permease C-terminal domain-containing protein, partial [Pseudohongiella sp.]|nr:amino acid permease C-terminal domain-containing protein [Pseudohongiella sp.]